MTANQHQIPDEQTARIAHHQAFHYPDNPHLDEGSRAPAKKMLLVVYEIDADNLQKSSGAPTFTGSRSGGGSSAVAEF